MTGSGANLVVLLRGPNPFATDVRVSGIGTITLADEGRATVHTEPLLVVS